MSVHLLAYSLDSSAAIVAGSEDIPAGFDHHMEQRAVRLDMSVENNLVAGCLCSFVGNDHCHSSGPGSSSQRVGWHCWCDYT